MRIALVSLAILTVTACGDGDEADTLGADAEGYAEAELRSNNNPNRLVVYSNNLENMLFDWKDLVHEMEEAPLRPDLFLVQQVTDKAELNRLIDFMERRLGREYGGLVAQNHPKDHRFHADVTPRPTVTTGVIYRKARFNVVNDDSWMPFGRGFQGQPQTCDARSNHSGYETLRVKLHDKEADKDIVVVSTRQWTWHPCTTKNMKEIVNGHDGGPNDHAGLGAAAALQIVAGDFNDRIFDGNGNYKCWYRQMTRGLGAGDCTGGDLGFTDPLFESCDGAKSCVKAKGGIDSLFVRRGDGEKARTDHFDVVSYAQAHQASVRATGGDVRSNKKPRDGYNDVAPRYSGHQARRAYVYYD